ncbi:MAG: helix-turn-helix domain-containing protein [Terrimicrobiaceae bacterium]
MNLTSSTSNDAILTKAEAAEFLRIKPRTVDEWMRRGRIPFCKLPSGTVRFRRDQLIEFLGKFEVGA